MKTTKRISRPKMNFSNGVVYCASFAVLMAQDVVTPPVGGISHASLTEEKTEMLGLNNAISKKTARVCRPIQTECLRSRIVWIASVMLVSSRTV